MFACACACIGVSHFSLSVEYLFILRFHWNSQGVLTLLFHHIIFIYIYGNSSAFVFMNSRVWGSGIVHHSRFCLKCHFWCEVKQKSPKQLQTWFNWQQISMSMQMKYHRPGWTRKTRPKLTNVERKTQFGNRTAEQTTIQRCVKIIRRGMDYFEPVNI
jgi:hypothetical protein